MIKFYLLSERNLHLHRPPRKHHFHFLHCCIGMLLSYGSGIVACLQSCCLSTGIFAELFPSNGGLCWLHSSCFQQHSTLCCDNCHCYDTWQKCKSCQQVCFTSQLNTAGQLKICAKWSVQAVNFCHHTFLTSEKRVMDFFNIFRWWTNHRYFHLTQN